MRELIEIDLSLSLSNLQEKAREIFDLLDISEGTRRDYAYRISLFLAFITQNGFDKNSFLEFKRSLKKRDDLTVATKNKYLASARVFLRELTRNGIMPLDITLNIKGFRQNKKHKKEGLTEREIEKIRDRIKTLPDTPTNARIKALFCLFALQGLRQIEVIRLNREDLDLVNGIAYIQGKGQDDKEMIYLHPQTSWSEPSWGTEVLIYTFSDERVTFPESIEEYNAIITPDQLKEYPILLGLIDETFVLTKLRKTFPSEEMGDDLVLVPVPKYIALGNIIDLNSPVGQFILIIGIFVFLLKIKNRVLKS